MTVQVPECMSYNAFTRSTCGARSMFIPTMNIIIIIIIVIMHCAEKLQSSSNAIACITGSQFENVGDYLISKYCGCNKVEIIRCTSTMYSQFNA